MLPTWEILLISVMMFILKASESEQCTLYDAYDPKCGPGSDCANDYYLTHGYQNFPGLIEGVNNQINTCVPCMKEKVIRLNEIECALAEAYSFRLRIEGVFETSDGNQKKCKITQDRRDEFIELSC